jgi:hypothetical protein
MYLRTLAYGLSRVISFFPLVNGPIIILGFFFIIIYYFFSMDPKTMKLYFVFIDRAALRTLDVRAPLGTLDSTRKKKKKKTTYFYILNTHQPH